MKNKPFSSFLIATAVIYVISSSACKDHNLVDRMGEKKVPSGVLDIRAEMGENMESILDPKSILKSWLNSYGNITSMKVSYFEEVVSATTSEENPGALNNLVRLQHVERIEDGQRFHIRDSQSKKPFEEVKSYSESCFDGKSLKEYMSEEGKGFGSIVKGLIGRDLETKNALKTYMMIDPVETRDLEGNIKRQIVFEEFVGSAINRNAVKVEQYMEEVNGEMCHVLNLLDNRGNIYYKIWVSHEKGMLPIKRQRFNNSKISSEFIVEQTERISNGIVDIWYPKVAYRTLYNEAKGTKIKCRLDVISFFPNIIVQESDFNFNFPNGTKVSDRVKGVWYTVGSSEKPRPIGEQNSVCLPEKK